MTSVGDMMIWDDDSCAIGLIVVGDRIAKWITVVEP